MLLCDVANLEPGMIVGGSIPHPKRPTTELLRPGAELDANMIEHLTRLGISEVWVAHDATSDLDAAVGSGLSVARMSVFQQLKTDFSRLSVSTVSGAKLQVYRQTVTDLVFELISTGQYAHLAHQMVNDTSGVFTHCANVAFLSVLVGLEMETYLVSQRPQLSPEHARDVVPLGLGAMLHDIGKTALNPEDRTKHEIANQPTDEDEIKNYRKHIFAGHKMLDVSRFPATARHAVLNHHQRFDGKGWPIQAARREGSETRPQRGTEIHIFSRIIAAANVLDNLINGANKPHISPVAALREFNSTRFDGWFDPVVRYLMIRRLPPFPIGSLVRLSNNAKATIVSLNFRQPCRPTVRMLDENTRNNKGEYTTVDLDIEPSIHIVESGGNNVEKHLFELPDLKSTVEKEKATSSA
ncbi:MAG: HD domain-containing protein [Planctomycetes bacterium]|nr:HD domain-containing protein [Planctomycetota bacterium]